MNDGPNYIALAVPFFFLFIFLELVAARVLAQRRVYRMADALADLGCGVGEQVGLVFVGAATMAAYVWLEGHALVRLPTWAAWVVAILGVDVAYYFWHRASHRVNVLWAAHAVHHQSEDYNLAVALRQGLFTPFTSAPFYLPLALLGVSPVVFATALSLDTLYQFWIHTELVGKLPRPLELVLNTPSHHRVHHAVNARYLDKNYAGIFIVWDRLFGTFVEESVPCTFGTVKRLFSFNAMKAQFAELGVVASKAEGASVVDKLRVWVMPPEWLPGGPKPIPEPPATKFESPAAPALQRYASVQFALMTVAAFLMMWFQNTLAPAELALPGALVFVTLLGLGGLMDGRRWALALECLRLPVVCTAFAVWTWADLGPTAIAVAATAFAIFAGQLWLSASGDASHTTWAKPVG